MVTSMKIWVDAETWLTRKIEQIDINGNLNSYTVNNVKENIELKDSLFQFEVPADAEIVDLRED
jgi:outer membrane lipoprotein-sorting protein